MSHTDDTMRSCIGDRIQAVVEVKKVLIIDYPQCTGFELTTAVPMGCEKNKLSSTKHTYTESVLRSALFILGMMCLSDALNTSYSKGEHRSASGQRYKRMTVQYESQNSESVGGLLYDELK